MGFLDKAKKLAVKAGPLIDKAAPHARTAVDKAGQQIDKRTGGKYHDKIEQVGEKVGEYADKRMAANGTGAAPAEDGFPPAPPPAATPPADSAGPTGTTPPATTPPADDGFPPTPPPATTPPADSASPTGTTPPPAADPNAPGDRPTP
jgi:hypothetical protein